MKKISIFIDGYDLYHAISSLKKSHFKWTNPKEVCRFFITDNFENIERVKFFTAPPIHKSSGVQEKYYTY
ncbi:MAG: hypothetical protein ABL857_08325, partial [Rickettsiales bacterium]